MTKQRDFELWADKLNLVDGMNLQDLEHLEDAITIARNRMMVAKLRNRGVTAWCEHHRPSMDYFSNHVWVKVDWENVPATLDECQRLLDTLVNLDTEAALQRWVQKIAPLEIESYTRADAIRDTRAARADLKRAYANDEITSDMYNDLYKTTSFMEYAE